MRFASILPPSGERPSAVDLGPRTTFVTALTVTSGFAHVALQSGMSPPAAGLLTVAVGGIALLTSRLAGATR